MEQIPQLLEQINLMSAVSLVVGIVFGAGLTALLKRDSGQAGTMADVLARDEAPSGTEGYTDDTQWLLKKQDLSGSQRQILEFIESSSETSIQAVQDRFGKVPDRELFYRLEQLHLMGFIDKNRSAEQVVYALSEAYRGAVQVPEDDKTVFIPRD